MINALLIWALANSWFVGPGGVRPGTTAAEAQKYAAGVEQIQKELDAWKSDWLAKHTTPSPAPAPAPAPEPSPAVAAEMTVTEAMEVAERATITAFSVVSPMGASDPTAIKIAAQLSARVANQVAAGVPAWQAAKAADKSARMMAASYGTQTGATRQELAWLAGVYIPY